MDAEKLKEIRAKVDELKADVIRLEEKINAPGGEELKEKLLSELEALRLRVIDIEKERHGGTNE